MDLPLKAGTIAFRPRARLLKLIGEELISDEVVAVSELVKNSHDADARTVTVAFRHVMDNDGEIEVRDDGIGMDLETLLGRWMEPAASTKVELERQITSRGRRVLGEKGVGRFAADKLGSRLELITRRAGASEEIRAYIDWDRFNVDNAMLADVKNRWEVVQPQVIKRSGTILRMSGLRSVWSERMFRRLGLRLSRLLSPFRKNDGFSIHIESDEFPEYSGELRSDLVEKAPYRVEAEFDGKQSISISVNGRPFSSQRWNGQGDLLCGPIRVRLFAFDLEGEALAKLGPRMEVRAWLREWTGVSIYRDGFRIWPYGEPHDDWLRLDQRRVNNPVERLSNNQVIGFIEIGRDSNPWLMDQTNREGLIHNRALDDLRRLVYFVFQTIEAERQSLRHPPQRITAIEHTNQQESHLFTDQIEEIAGKVNREASTQLRQLARRLEEHLRSRDQQQRQSVAGLSGLAAAGAWSGGLVPIFMQRLGQVKSDLDSFGSFCENHDPVPSRVVFSKIKESVSILSEQLRMLQLVSSGGDRRRAIDIMAELNVFRKTILPLLTETNVEMTLDYPEKIVLRTEMRPEYFHCILQILTANSLDWLASVESRKIKISADGNESQCELIFSDNGPGISASHQGRIFEPLFTGKEGGKGMGLTIARQILEANGGNIQLIVDGRRRGANFRIILPRKRSRATFSNKS